MNDSFIITTIRMPESFKQILAFLCSDDLFCITCKSNYFSCDFTAGGRKSYLSKGGRIFAWSACHMGSSSGYHWRRLYGYCRYVVGTCLDKFVVKCHKIHTIGWNDYHIHGRASGITSRGEMSMEPRNAFVAGSTFAIVHEPPVVWLCILLSIRGFVGWIVPYFLYGKIRRKNTQKIQLLIEAKYEEIYEICEKGHALL